MVDVPHGQHHDQPVPPCLLGRVDVYDLVGQVSMHDACHAHDDPEECNRLYVDFAKHFHVVENGVEYNSHI